MKQRRRLGLELALGALGAVLALGCSPARAPLPPAPAPASPEQLVPWRQPPPLAPEERAEVRLATSHFRLENGLGVSVSVTAGGASTSLELRVPSGRDRSQGAVTAMANALRAGTLDGTADPFFNPKLALIPIGLWTDGVATSFVWRVPQRGTERALSLLGSFVREPAFDPDDVQLRLQQQLASIRDSSAPLNQLQQLARAGIPGLERPSHERDARGVLALTPATLHEIHRCALQPKDAELVIVGPVSPDAVKAWATAAFGAWRADAGASAACADWLTPPLPEHPERARRERPLLLVIYGANFDPWLAIDVPGPPIDSADYLPFELLAALLEQHRSGSAKALRHAGATYGIHISTYDRYAHVSLLEIRGQVDPERAQAALRGLVDDIRGLAGHLEEAELEAVKRRWRTETVNSWARSDGLAGALQWQLRRGHAAEELAQVLEEGQRIDVALCRQVAERYLTHAQPSIAVTGLTQHLVRGLGLDAELRQVFWTDQPQEQKKLH